MSIHQHAVENQIAIMAADAEHDRVQRLGGNREDAIRAWYAVIDEVLKIAERGDD